MEAYVLGLPRTMQVTIPRADRGGSEVWQQRGRACCAGSEVLATSSARTEYRCRAAAAATPDAADPLRLLCRGCQRHLRRKLVSLPATVAAASVTNFVMDPQRTCVGELTISYARSSPVASRHPAARVSLVQRRCRRDDIGMGLHRRVCSHLHVTQVSPGCRTLRPAGRPMNHSHCAESSAGGRRLLFMCHCSLGHWCAKLSHENSEHARVATSFLTRRLTVK